jgi:regulator of sirC expression with transglutaminase-like and TPR domain
LIRGYPENAPGATANGVCGNRRELLAPKDANAYRARGMAIVCANEFQRAIADLSAAGRETTEQRVAVPADLIRIKPDDL